VIESDRDHFLHAARRLAAKDRNGLADPEDIASKAPPGTQVVDSRGTVIGNLVVQFVSGESVGSSTVCARSMGLGHYWWVV
jgi:hypothetical protein